MTNTGVDNLRTAILEQAIKDYVRSYSEILNVRHKCAERMTSEAMLTKLNFHENNLSNIERFFFSDWCNQLVDIDPTDLIRLCEKMGDKIHQNWVSRKEQQNDNSPNVCWRKKRPIN